jgi:murein DD-endopeptidase MepM/ murein hydrolase activator NlpD
MPYNQALSSQESDLDSNSLNQSHSISAKVAKLVNKPSIKIGLTVSLVAATIYQPNSKQAVYAVDLNQKTRDNSTSVTSESSISALEAAPKPVLGINYTPGFLPRILSLITSRFDNLSTLESKKQESPSVVVPEQVDQDVNLSHGSSYPQSNFYLATNTKIESSKLPFSSTASISKPQLRIHTVRPGDTINQIASRYQVSREEIIQLNNIKDSNIIFVAQQLKIPAQLPQNSTTQSQTRLNPDNIAQVSKLKLAPFEASNLNTRTNNSSSSTDDPYIAKLRAEIEQMRALAVSAKKNTPSEASNLNTRANNSSSLADDPYIAKLRAEIEQMRTQYQNQKQGNTGNNLTSSMPSRSLNNNTGGTYATPENNTQNTYNQVSATPKYDLQPNSLAEETIALKLPPLPPSEEYLPATFDGYAWPAQGALTSGYGYRWGRLHAGIDIAAPIGTPVLAAASGEVIEAGWNSGGYGNLVKLQHLDGSVTLYGHNDRILVSLGQKVAQGEQIAEMGSTGYSTGSHLHFEIHPTGEAAVDPIAYLSK